MQLKILQHFNITSDLLSNDLIRGARYDVGELNHFLVGMKPLLHLSLFEPSTDALYFNFTQLECKSKISHPVDLIYFPAPDSDILKHAGQSKRNQQQFYFVVTGHVDQHFLETAACFGIEKFNFANAFKKAHLKEWRIVLGSAVGLKPNCTLINTFLAHGASLSTLDAKVLPPHSSLELKASVALSFQHSIDIYEIKKI